MSTSNSYNYTIDRDTLIRTSFETLGIAVEGEDLDAEDITVAARTLNMMIKSWVVHGLHVWKRKTYTITPLVLNQQYYDLGTHETNVITVTGDGTTAVSVAHPYHGYKTGDSITITGASDDTDINGTFTITVTDPSTYTYTALAAVDSGLETGSTVAVLQGYKDNPRPEKILDVSRVDSSGNETQITVISRDEYENLPNKTTAGTPVNCHYERNLGAGRLYVWPVASAQAVSDFTINITYQSQFEDMDSATDNFDFPPEWLEPISLGLAHRLAPKYGIKAGERDRLYRDMNEALDLALGHDNEEASVYFQPEMSR